MFIYILVYIMLTALMLTVRDMQKIKREKKELEEKVRQLEEDIEKIIRDE